MDQLKAMPAYTEFLLANTTKQQFDTYASYTGVKLKDLIAAAGVDPTDPAIQGGTVIAPDGFLKDIPADNLNAPYPPGQFFGGLDTATLGTECGFVQYPDALPDGVTGGAPIPGDPWLMLAYDREGLAMILDDWDNNGRTDFVYDGWEWRVFWRVNPLIELLAPARWLDDHVLELGFRYDVLSTESDESGVRARQRTWTPAVNYLYKDHVKLQLDWLVRRNEDPTKPSVPDNAVILSLQGKI